MSYEIETHQVFWEFGSDVSAIHLFLIEHWYTSWSGTVPQMVESLKDPKFSPPPP